MKTTSTIALLFAGLSFLLLADPTRKVVLSTSVAELSTDKVYSLVEISGDKPSYPKKFDEGDYEAEMIGSNDKIITKAKSNQKSYNSVEKLVVKETATGKELYVIENPSLKSDDVPIQDQVSKDFNEFRLSANGKLVIYFYNSNGVIYNKDMNSLVELPIHLLIDKKEIQTSLWQWLTGDLLYTNLHEEKNSYAVYDTKSGKTYRLLVTEAIEKQKYILSRVSKKNGIVELKKYRMMNEEEIEVLGSFGFFRIVENKQSK